MNQINIKNIADIALTAYKKMQRGEAINLQSIVKPAVASLGIRMVTNHLTGQSQKNTKAQKAFLVGGLVLIGVNQLTKGKSLV